MILDRLIKLDKRKRVSAAVLTVLAAAFICYFVITRNSVINLQTVKADYTGIRNVYTVAQYQQAGLADLQKRLKEKEERLQDRQRQCFSGAEASRLFENINAMASAYNLKPISRVISEPKNFDDSEINDGNAPPPQFLKTQTARISVAGNYFNIIDFLNELIDRPQKISITNLYITLPAGERFNPKASFEIVLVIDSSKDAKK
jgi:Tfp pilus assembly protein PilO